MNTRRGIAREPGCELELAPGEPHRDLADANLPRAVVDDERPGLDDIGLPEHGPPEERPDAREELQVHVAGDDVVRPALEGADAHDGVGARLGQHDDRHVPVPRPPRLARA